MNWRNRRVLCLVIIVLMFIQILPVWANQSAYGYSWTLGGLSYLPDSAEGIGFSGVSLVASPFTWTFFEPSFTLEGKLALRRNFIGIHDVSLGLNLTLFKTIQHPFKFLVPTNLTAYAPAVNLALQHTLQDGDPLRVVAGVSFIRLLEKDAWYEWFSPFVIINPYAAECEAWGIVLWRFTYLVF
jgi:hypothetical protein